MAVREAPHQPCRNGRRRTQILAVELCLSQAAQETGLRHKGKTLPPRPARGVRKPSIWFEMARRAALSLPGVEERTTTQGPVFQVGRKLLARLDQDGVSLLVDIGPDEREMLIEAEPRTFSGTGRRRGHLRLRVDLAYVDERRLRRILEQSWRERAPKRLQRRHAVS
ncbi:MmcQ/YjbR family DNA-binding protein [Methylobacterium nigriterrae]|uniref:MmcQ/YjbR family DNA-binding protein n=1 Tax=Methylobacterium nigriterrae TaxID=3127512 RepID=UPI0030133DC6